MTRTYTDGDAAQGAIPGQPGTPHENKKIVSRLHARAHAAMARLYLAPGRGAKPLSSDECTRCLQEAGSKTRNPFATMNAMVKDGLLQESDEVIHRLRIPVTDIVVFASLGRGKGSEQTWPAVAPTSTPIAPVPPRTKDAEQVSTAGVAQLLRGIVTDLALARPDGIMSSPDLFAVLRAKGRQKPAKDVYMLEQAKFLVCVGGTKRSHKDRPRFKLATAIDQATQAVEEAPVPHPTLVLPSRASLESDLLLVTSEITRLELAAATWTNTSREIEERIRAAERELEKLRAACYAHLEEEDPRKKLAALRERQQRLQAVLNGYEALLALATP